MTFYVFLSCCTRFLEHCFNADPVNLHCHMESIYLLTSRSAICKLFQTKTKARYIAITTV